MLSRHRRDRARLLQYYGLQSGRVAWRTRLVGGSSIARDHIWASGFW